MGNVIRLGNDNAVSRAAADAFERGKQRWLQAVRAAVASGAKYTTTRKAATNETTVILENVTEGHAVPLAAVGFARLSPESALWVCAQPTMPAVAAPVHAANRADRRRASALRIR